MIVSPYSSVGTGSALLIRHAVHDGSDLQVGLQAGIENDGAGDWA
jgi:hypothetical protein